MEGEISGYWVDCWADRRPTNREWKSQLRYIDVNNPTVISLIIDISVIYLSRPLPAASSLCSISISLRCWFMCFVPNIMNRNIGLHYRIIFGGVDYGGTFLPKIHDYYGFIDRLSQFRPPDEWYFRIRPPKMPVNCDRRFVDLGISGVWERCEESVLWIHFALFKLSSNCVCCWMEGKMICNQIYSHLLKCKGAANQFRADLKRCFDTRRCLQRTW